MRRQVRSVLLLCAFLFGLGLLPGALRAQAATPIPLQDDFPPEFCTPQEITNGEMNIEEFPEATALVSPASTPNMDLYVVRIKLPGHTCVSFTGHNLHDGAAIWLVESGKVIFSFQPIPNWPLPDLVFQPKDEDRLPGTAHMELTEDAWVSTDRAVHYSYLNPDDAEAIIVMTVLENRVIFTGNDVDATALDAAGCKGVCRRR